MLNQIRLALLFLGLTSAHFVLNWPPSAGFDEDKEPTSPCGGFTPSMKGSTPDVQVGRFAISIENGHPVGQWSFRGTTNTEAPFNFTEIGPVVNTSGMGEFCLDYMSVPSGWAGNSGIIQVVDQSSDGVLYQCAAVNFVAGSNNTIGSNCNNARTTWTKQESFQGEEGGMSHGDHDHHHDHGTMSMSMSSSPAATAASSSSSSGVAAMVTGISGVLGGIGLLAAGMAL